MSAILAVVFAVLTALDIHSTRQALKKPGAYEKNPVIAWLMKFGNAWIVVKIVVSAFAIWMAWGNLWVMVPLIAVYAYAVRNNYKLAR